MWVPWCQSSDSRTSLSETFGRKITTSENPVWSGDPLWPTRPRKLHTQQGFKFRISSPPPAPQAAAGGNGVTTGLLESEHPPFPRRLRVGSCVYPQRRVRWFKQLGNQDKSRENRRNVHLQGRTETRRVRVRQLIWRLAVWSPRVSRRKLMPSLVELVDQFHHNDSIWHPSPRHCSRSAKSLSSARTATGFSLAIWTNGPTGLMTKPDQVLISDRTVFFQLNGVPKAKSTAKTAGVRHSWLWGSSKNRPQTRSPSPQSIWGKEAIQQSQQKSRHSPPIKLSTRHTIGANLVDPPLLVDLGHLILPSRLKNLDSTATCGDLRPCRCGTQWNGHLDPPGERASPGRAPHSTQASSHSPSMVLPRPHTLSTSWHANGSHHHRGSTCCAALWPLPRRIQESTSWLPVEPLGQWQNSGHRWPNTRPTGIDRHLSHSASSCPWEGRKFHFQSIVGSHCPRSRECQSAEWSAAFPPVVGSATLFTLAILVPSSLEAHHRSVLPMRCGWIQGPPRTSFSRPPWTWSSPTSSASLLLGGHQLSRHPTASHGWCQNSPAA